jgi:chemotaxis protein methyltransferase WspC
MNVEASMLELIKTRMGLDAASVGVATVRQAILDGMEERAAVSLEEYERILRREPEALDALVEKLVVPETWFFRDEKPFAVLKALAKSRYDSNEPPLRVLSIPCATGEEPYSIAMTLLDAGLRIGTFSVDAVDISRVALHRAKEAVYGANSFRIKDLEFRDRYFRTVSPGKYSLKEEVRSSVTFYHANLLDERFLHNHVPYEVIFCRNVLIYFDGADRERALTGIKRLLLPGGLLFVGHAELLPMFNREFRLLPETSAFAYIYVGAVEPWQAPSSKRIPAPARRESAVGSMLKGRPEPVVGNGKKPVASSLGAVSGVPWDDLLAEATILANRGEYDRALGLAEACLLRNRGAAEVYYLIGTIRMALGQSAKAEEMLQKVLYLNPKHEEALLHCALLCDKRGDVLGAARMRQRADRLRREGKEA